MVKRSGDPFSRKSTKFVSFSATLEWTANAPLCRSKQQVLDGWNRHVHHEKSLDVFAFHEEKKRKKKLIKATKQWLGICDDGKQSFHSGSYTITWWSNIRRCLTYWQVLSVEIWNWMISQNNFPFISSSNACLLMFSIKRGAHIEGLTFTPMQIDPATTHLSLLVRFINQ